MALPRDPTEDMVRLEIEGIQQQQLAQKLPDPHYIRRYSRYFRKLDRAMLKLFGDLEVLDARGVPMPVPIIMGTVERAVAAFFGQTSTFREDCSGQMRRVILPASALTPGDPAPDPSRFAYHKSIFWDRLNTERRRNDVAYGFTRGLPIDRTYTLTLWSRYMEHMNQMSEIVLLKFSPIAEIRIPDNPFPTDVNLDSFGTNFSDPPEEADIKVYKADISMTVKGYLPQPIRREKTVLDLRFQMGTGNPEKHGEFELAEEVSLSVTPKPADYGPVPSE